MTVHLTVNEIFQVSQTSQGVSQAPVVTESYQRQAFSLSYGQKMADTDKSRGKSSSVSGTIVELLDRPTTSVKNELRHPQLDRDTQNAFDAVRLSTQVSNKFTDNFQHGEADFCFSLHFVSNFTE